MKNIGNAPLQIAHSELLRCGDSLYKSKCPVCPDGVLLMRRGEPIFDLLAFDRCILCGQAVVYTDIEKIRETDLS